MDLVHQMDLKYSGSGAVVCPNEGERFVLGTQSKQIRTEHGHLGVHGSGAYLVCACGYQQPTSAI